MLRHVLVLVSFCASFFIQPTVADAAQHRHGRTAPSPAVTVESPRRAHWSDAFVCAVAAYLPPVARWCTETGAVAWRQVVAETRAWMRSVVDEYRRVMTESKHMAVPPPHV